MDLFIAVSQAHPDIRPQWWVDEVRPGMDHNIHARRHGPYHSREEAEDAAKAMTALPVRGSDQDQT